MAPAAWFSLLASLIPQSVLSLLGDIRILPQEEVTAFKPYTWYAATTACNISDIITWTCGEKCDANPKFEPIAVGGNGNETQFWFTGYDPTLNEVIVTHQGTNSTIAEIIDLEVCLVPLNSTLFLGVDEAVLVHQGFSRSHGRSAPDIIAAVKQGLSLHPTKKVTVVGPSLGAALALLDAVYLPLHLPSDVTVRYVGYGSPKVGNQAFADYVDAQGMSTTCINNKQDPIPLLPFMEFFEYHHVSGEIHVRNDGMWVECPGQDNPSEQCSTGAVTLATADPSEHNKEFDGVPMGEC